MTEEPELGNRRRRPVVAVAVLVAIVSAGVTVAILNRGSAKTTVTTSGTIPSSCVVEGLPSYVVAETFADVASSDPRPATAAFVRTTRGALEAMNGSGQPSPDT